MEYLIFSVVLLAVIVIIFKYGEQKGIRDAVDDVKKESKEKEEELKDEVEDIRNTDISTGDANKWL